MFINLSIVSHYAGKNQKSLLLEKDTSGKISHYTLILIVKNLVYLFLCPTLIVGASPDGSINCSCCCAGILKINCPWVSQDKTIPEYVNHPESCLEFIDNKISLKKGHPYMKQVQHQMFITQTSYCGFEVFLVQESTTIRIYKDMMYEKEIVPMHV